MAYGSNNTSRPGGYGSKPAAATTSAAPTAVAATTGTKSYPVPEGQLMRVNLSKPKSDKAKAVFSGVTKEDVTIPAGSYIDLFENQSKSGDGVYLTLQIKKARPKQN